MCRLQLTLQWFSFFIATPIMAHSSADESGGLIFFYSLFGNANTEASRQQTVVYNYLFKQREKCLKCYRKRAINANFMDNLASGSLCSHWIFLIFFFKFSSLEKPFYRVAKEQLSNWAKVNDANWSKVWIYVWCIKKTLL